MSIDHKPTDDGERARIEKAGSEVTAEGRVDGNLNLSRSLGDLKYKNKTHLTQEEQAITANPDTYVFDLTNDIDFILMGCDGIWEKHSNEEAVAWFQDKIGDKGLNDINIKALTEEYLHYNCAVDVQSSGKYFSFILTNFLYRGCWMRQYDMLPYRFRPIAIMKVVKTRYKSNKQDQS